MPREWKVPLHLKSTIRRVFPVFWHSINDQLGYYLNCSFFNKKCFSISELKEKNPSCDISEFNQKLEESRISFIEICVNTVGKHLFCKASNANLSDTKQNKHPYL